MTNFSPLRYPGGKGKLAPYLREVMQLNDLTSAHYAEPFAGGAAVALTLLFSGYVSHIHINDIDPCVHAFWDSAVNDTDRLIEKILSTEISVENWLLQREVKRLPHEHDALQLGFAAFFLNRTNRSGILNGGMIGGLGQNGPWRLDCRYNKKDLVQRLKRIGYYRSRISVTKLDASTFIGNYLRNLTSDCFVYVDPPYYLKGAYLYENHYVHSDHAKLAMQISNINHRWIVSYDNAEQIKKIYSKYEQEEFSIGYSARNHSEGAEVMVFSEGLKRPKTVYSSKRQKRQLLCAAAAS